VSPLKIKIPIKNFGRQRCAEEFNSGVKGLKNQAHLQVLPQPCNALSVQETTPKVHKTNMLIYLL
jgi:hypothetical protein